MSLFAPRDPAVAVSVIIPVYRPVRFLIGTLASIFQEGLSNIQVIVVDDGSPLDVAAACGEYRSRITLHRQANAGRCIARNNGMLLASGAYIHFLDADDQVGDRFYGRGIAAFARHPQWDVLGVEVAFMDAENRLTGRRNGARFSGVAWPGLAMAMPIPPVAYLFRRECIERAGAFDPAMLLCEDWDLWVRVARTGACFQSVHRGLALYRVHAQSNSRNHRTYFESCRRIITATIRPDPRVAEPDPRFAAGLDGRGAGQRIAESAATALGAMLSERDAAGCHALALELLAAVADQPMDGRLAACAWYAARDLLIARDAAWLAVEVWPTLLQLAQLLSPQPRGDELARLLCRHFLDVPARDRVERPPRSPLRWVKRLAKALLRPTPSAQPCPIAAE